MTTNEIKTAIETIDTQIKEVAAEKDQIERVNDKYYLYSRKKQDLVKRLKALGLKETGNMDSLVSRLMSHYEKEIERLDARASELQAEKDKLVSELKEIKSAHPIAYRHSWNGEKFFYYHQSCVERNPPGDAVTFEQIALSTVPQGVQCDCCYKPIHDPLSPETPFKTVQKYPDGSEVKVNGQEWTVQDMSRDSEALLQGQEDRGEDYNLYRLIRHNTNSILRWQYELDAEQQLASEGKVEA